jgi:imidazolonepropionase
VTAFAVAARRIVTCDPTRGTRDNPLAAIDEGAVVIEAGRIVWVGPRAEAPAGVPIDDVGDAVVTPGLVDAHTHSAFAGSRHDEYAIRMAGGDYRAIASAGGGIRATQRAVAAATEETLAETTRVRLVRMARLGVTTVEVKSGYGLEPDEETKLLRAIARAAADDALPRVVPTFLALHAIPASRQSDRAAYVAEMCAMVERVRSLARFVDAYVDENAFRTDEARALCSAARRAGLGVRLHVGQFADVGGAELCAEMGAASADHLEHVSEVGIAALARAGTTAVLLPTASFTLKQSPPPVDALRAAGVPLAVASDANPGTAPTESLPLAMAFAIHSYGLSPDEAILGATRVAARSLGVDAGVLSAGAPADLVAWDLPHEHAIVQPWGVEKTTRVWRGGQLVSEARAR